MKRSVTWCIPLLALAALTGCAPNVVTNYDTLSFHTLRVAADKDADVVWVQQYKDREFILMRCHNASEAPACVRVRTP